MFIELFYITENYRKEDSVYSETGIFSWIYFMLLVINLENGGD